MSRRINMKNKTHKEQMKHKETFKFKKVHIISALVVVIIIALVITGISIYNSIDKTVITVDGEKITQKELVRVMQEKEEEVYSYFKTKYKVDTTNANFWYGSFGESKEIPIEYLKKISTDGVIKIKMQQIMAKEYGLKDDISYETFLEDYKKEYQRRQDPNEKVVGVRTIQVLNYFNEVFKTLQENLKTKLIEKNALVIDEKDTLAYYQAEKESKFKKQDYLHIQYVSCNLQQVLADKKEKIADHKDNIIKKLNEIKVSIEKGKDPETVCKEMTDSSYVFRYVDEKMDQEYIGRDYEGYKVLSKIVTDAPIGKYMDAALYEDDSRIMIVKLIERRDEGYTSFEEAKDMINDVVISENKYYELVDKRVSQAKIVKNA